MGGKFSRGNREEKEDPNKENEKHDEEENKEGCKEDKLERPLTRGESISSEDGGTNQETANMESSNRSHEAFLSLPPELVMKILKTLTHRCLCHVALTCRYLSQVASDPDLWTDMAINRLKVKECGMADFYKIPRFSKLKNLYLADLGIDGGLFLSSDILTEVLSYVHTRAMDGTHLESLDLTWARVMHEVSTELVKTALPKVRYLNICSAGISQHQLEELLKKIPSSDIIEKLAISHALGPSNCPEELIIDPNILAEAFCSLKKVHADSTSMNTLQVIALFSKILTTDTLEYLNMYNSSLYEVPSELINKAICKLNHIDIGFCLKAGYDVEAQRKVTSLFAALSASTRLQSINFYNADMSQIDPVIMARGVCHIPRVEFKYLRLTTNHLNEIARCRVNEKCNLMDLDISENDFSELTECELVGQAIGRMRKVNFEMTQLSKDQWSSIINAIVELGDERQLTWDNLLTLPEGNSRDPRKLLREAKWSQQRATAKFY